MSTLALCEPRAVSTSPFQPISKPEKPTSNPYLVYLAGLSTEMSRAGMRGKLNRISKTLGYSDAESVPWTSLRFEHVSALRSKMIEDGLSPATINCTLAAIRGVLRAAFNLGCYQSDDLRRVEAVKPVRGERLLSGRALQVGEVAALLLACAEDRSPIGSRDAAIIALMFGTGLRRSEVVSLDLSDFNFSDWSFTVIGKGSKERTCYPQNGLRFALEDWFAVRGNWEGPAFVRVRKGGRIQRERLGRMTIQNILSRRSKEAQIGKVTPHDMRRTFITRLLEAGADVLTVQDMAGHSQTETTKRYDLRGEDSKRKAAEMLAVPYSRRGNR